VGTYFGVNSSFIRLKDIYWIDEIKKTPVDIPVKAELNKTIIYISLIAL
jgi:hypothetical protein